MLNDADSSIVCQILDSPVRETSRFVHALSALLVWVVRAWVTTLVPHKAFDVVSLPFGGERLYRSADYHLRQKRE